MMKDFAEWLGVKLICRVASRRPPDLRVGPPEDPYLERWLLIPRNPLLNVYLHKISRSDDDRALHDHPWPNLSLVLIGGYHEHTIAAGGIHRRRWRGPGALKLRGPWAAHRLEIPEPTAADPYATWTLFLTGPRLRTWGFHCAEAGWVDWRNFVDRDGLKGRGCGEPPQGEKP